ncbi:MAG: hypothetical protein FJX62_15000 [Alphaproteobacteria bacterium]|nr:hypothetical protein [Alphaproteobacteria bacterium]
MNLTLRLAAIAALAFVTAVPSAIAEENRISVKVGSALICDTQQQVERFVTLFEGDIETTLVAVNGEQPEPNACDVATIAYVLGPQVATASARTGTYRIVRVLVVGALTEDGMTASEPISLFSVMRDEEREA